MKNSVRFSLVSAFAFLAHLAMAAEPADHSNVDSGDRPIGVEAKDWIPISDKLGFAILKTEQSPSDKATLGLDRPCIAIPRAAKREPQTPATQYLGQCIPVTRVATPPAPAAGYFMVKTAEGWRRLVVMTPADILAAKN